GLGLGRTRGRVGSGRSERSRVLRGRGGPFAHAHPADRDGGCVDRFHASILLWGRFPSGSLTLEGDMNGPFLFILGRPLNHSSSPAMQNAALRTLGLPWSYVPVDLSPEEIPQAIERFRASGVLGGNVTVPYKEKMAPWVDAVEGPVRDLGSVNTVYRRGSRWI